MSTPTRTVKNLWRIGPRMFGHQLQHMGDTKYGTLIGQDRYGNKFYENTEEELPLRTRWVDFKDKEFDSSQVEPGWHAWLGYMTHDAPPNDPIAQTMQRTWELPSHRPNLTASRSFFRTFNTVKPKLEPWFPQAKERGA